VAGVNQQWFEPALAGRPQSPHYQWNSGADPRIPQYAGFWTRIGAFIIDCVVIAVFIAVYNLVTTIFSGQILALGPSPRTESGYYATSFVILLIQMGLVVVYYAGFESSAWQATPGKLAAGIRVTKVDGERVSFLQAVARHIASGFSWILFSIGYLIQPFTQRRQTLHDLITGTVVVERNWAEWRQRTMVYAPPALVTPSLRYPGWAWFLVIVTTVAVAGSGGLIYGIALPLRHRAEIAVTNVLADEIASEVAILPVNGGQVVVTQNALDLQIRWTPPAKLTSGPGIGGVDSGFLIEMRVVVDDEKVAFLFEDTTAYRAVPAMSEGRLFVNGGGSRGHVHIREINCHRTQFSRGLRRGRQPCACVTGSPTDRH
jgi:uncharacterized RDD family membrane protein YckC